MTGKLVSLADALDGCERILRDEFKDHPESALYMIGAIDEAKRKKKPVASAAEPEEVDGEDGEHSATDRRESSSDGGAKHGPERTHAAEHHGS